MTNLTIKIEYAVQNDLGNITKMTRENNLGNWSSDDFSGYIQNTSAIFNVIKYGKTTVGYLLANKYESEAEIINFCIDEKHRRRGFGKLLLMDFLERCRSLKIGKIWLEVRSSNAAAKNLYEKHEFIVSGTRKNYYTNPPEDADLMVLEF